MTVRSMSHTSVDFYPGRSHPGGVKRPPLEKGSAPCACSTPAPIQERCKAAHRLFDAGEDLLVQLRPARRGDHEAIAPRYVPEGEILGRVSKAALLEAVRTLGLA